MFVSFTDYIMSGYALGQFNVGVQYFSGKGVELDYAKAVEFYENAAKQGFAPAQVLSFFLNALALYIIAVISSLLVLQVNLGNMYFNGRGVDKDWGKAKELYKAASASDKNAEELYKHVVKEEKRLEEETSKNTTKPDS